MSLTQSATGLTTPQSTHIASQVRPPKIEDEPPCLPDETAVRATLNTGLPTGYSSELRHSFSVLQQENGLLRNEVLRLNGELGLQKKQMDLIHASNGRLGDEVRRLEGSIQVLVRQNGLLSDIVAGNASPDYKTLYQEFVTLRGLYANALHQLGRVPLGLEQQQVHPEPSRRVAQPYPSPGVSVPPQGFRPPANAPGNLQPIQNPRRTSAPAMTSAPQYYSSGPNSQAPQYPFYVNPPVVPQAPRPHQPPAIRTSMSVSPTTTRPYSQLPSPFSQPVSPALEGPRTGPLNISDHAKRTQTMPPSHSAPIMINQAPQNRVYPANLSHPQFRPAPNFTSMHKAPISPQSASVPSPRPPTRGSSVTSPTEVTDSFSTPSVNASPLRTTHQPEKRPILDELPNISRKRQRIESLPEPAQVISSHPPITPPLEDPPVILDDDDDSDEWEESKRDPDGLFPLQQCIDFFLSTDENDPSTRQCELCVGRAQMFPEGAPPIFKDASQETLLHHFTDTHPEAFNKLRQKGPL